MSVKLPAGSLFPFSMLAFATVGVRYLDVLFNTATRWAILAIFACTLLARGQLLLAYRAKFGLVLLWYFLWCSLTVLWSEIPILSFEKAILYSLTVTCFVSAGIVWGRNAGRDRSLSYLMPIVVALIFSGLAGGDQFQDIGGDLPIYQGLTPNPNFLGFLAAVSLPFVLYRVYVAHRRPRMGLARPASLALLGIVLVLLWLSGSRASAACGLVICLAFVLSALPRRIVPTVILAMLLAGAAVVVVPAISGAAYERLAVFAFKTTNADQSILFSRVVVWAADYDAALKGGLTGVGLGVSAGDTNFTGGFTANLYGRAKANSQLVAIEEVGVVGFVLFVIMIAQILWTIVRAMGSIPDADHRVQNALLLGAIVGLLIQSIFEAWWTTAGSPESVVFWSTVGVATGLVSRYPRRAQRARIGEVLGKPLNQGNAAT